MAPGTFAKSISQVKTITKAAIKNNSDGSESSIIGRHRKPIGPFRT